MLRFRAARVCIFLAWNMSQPIKSLLVYVNCETFTIECYLLHSFYSTWQFGKKEGNSCQILAENTRDINTNSLFIWFKNFVIHYFCSSLYFLLNYLFSTWQYNERWTSIRSIYPNIPGFALISLKIPRMIFVQNCDFPFFKSSYVVKNKQIDTNKRVRKIWRSQGTIHSRNRWFY